MAKRLQKSVRRRHVVRSLLADARIENPYGGLLIFYPDASIELCVQMPRAAFEKLRDHMTAELERVSPRARRGASSPSATSRNK